MSSPNGSLCARSHKGDALKSFPIIFIFLTRSEKEGILLFIMELKGGDQHEAI